jgi:type VI protein secretion system component VasK
MLILGLILVALGALAIVGGVFASEIEGGQLQFLGQDVDPVVLFLIGVGAAVAIWWGLWLMKAGTKRSWARRKEQKRLEELSAKLDDVDERRRMDVEEHEEKDRPSL